MEPTDFIQEYLPALDLLARYDEGELNAPKGRPATWELTYEDALAFIQSLPFYETSGLFGRERDGSFEGIVRGLYQSFAGFELYPSLQAKAANLLYQVVKDHPFYDGNSAVPRPSSCISSSATVRWDRATAGSPPTPWPPPRCWSPCRRRPRRT